jgi:membrane protease subunit (stomatin/prohibitin family)
VGFLGEMRREFIARPDSSKNQIIFKWPDQNIRKLSQLTVQQDEVAVFFRDGRVQGTVQPGRVTLDSSEIPFLGALLDFATGGNLFKTELYFVSTREFPNLPFGGVVDNVLDPDTQLAVGLRVFGDYSLKVVEPQSLIVNLVGTQNVESNDSISDWMREQLMKVFRTEVVSEITKNTWPVLGIAAHTAELEASTLDNVQTQVNAYGIRIARLGNFTISLNDDDATTLKNFRRDASYTKLAGGFQQYGMGEALRGLGEGAAKGGEAGGNAFLGIGMGMGQFAAGLAGQAQANQAAAAAGAAQPVQQVRAAEACPHCGVQHPIGAKFCPNCGTHLSAPAQTCAKCGTENAPGAKFCANCGTSLAPEVPPA